MKNILIIFSIFLSLACKSQDIIQLPKDFEKKSFNHIEKLSGFGMRSAETEAERMTIEYIQKEFESFGLKTQVDTFKFKCFIVENKTFRINDKNYSFEKLASNPYINGENIHGKSYIFHPDSAYENLPDLTEKVLITKEPAVYWKLDEKEPIALIYLNDSVFEIVSRLNNIDIELTNIGRVKEFTTYNVIGLLDSNSEKEIVISAHWDSYVGPGANDNASGVGVMLELAGYFSENKNSCSTDLRFVAFGAEEQGMLGSKFFIEKYQENRHNCIFNFNIDMVGDSGVTGIVLNGVESLKPIDNLSFDYLAKSDFNNNWLASGHEFHLQTPTIVPEWLKSNINTTSKQLDIDIIPVGETGSDHRIFAYSGIPSTEIFFADTTLIKRRHHTENDLIKYINKESLIKTGLIVANTIFKTMEMNE